MKHLFKFGKKACASMAWVTLFLGAAPWVAAQEAYPTKPIRIVMGFPAGGPLDQHARLLSDRLQQVLGQPILIDYKAGAGGALMWGQMNQLPGDGVNVVGVNLPHIVFQPLEGQVQYKTADVVPVYWFHYTPDILVVPESSAIKIFADFVKAAKASPEKISLGGSGLNSANHAAHERLNAIFQIKTTYVPFKGTGDMATAVLGAQVDGADVISGDGDAGAIDLQPAAGLLQLGEHRPQVIADHRRHHHRSERDDSGGTGQRALFFEQMALDRVPARAAKGLGPTVPQPALAAEDARPALHVLARQSQGVMHLVRDRLGQMGPDPGAHLLAKRFFLWRESQVHVCLRG